MNAKVVLIKGRAERTLELKDNFIHSRTEYSTSFDAEGVYVRTKTFLKKQGWKRKPTVISKIENVGRRFKSRRILGHSVRKDEMVGE